MVEFIQNIIERISLSNLNILILIGITLFGGTIGGRLFQKLKIPQVVGYIIIGILVGRSGLKIVNSHIISILEPFSYFSLGIIGFMIGGGRIDFASTQDPVGDVWNPVIPVYSDFQINPTAAGLMEVMGRPALAFSNDDYSGNCKLL
ncbi:MAG: cation:proton antiporter, partial [Spirochaetes bacterium]|nr:cation:proton antiporter [Spirochaetota bacterium]